MDISFCRWGVGIKAHSTIAAPTNTVDPWVGVEEVLPEGIRIPRFAQCETCAIVRDVGHSNRPSASEEDHDLVNAREVNAFKISKFAVLPSATGSVLPRVWPFELKVANLGAESLNIARGTWVRAKPAQLVGAWP
jgi:hypothetical protein